MLLEAALEEIKTFDAPDELIKRQGLNVNVRLQGHSLLAEFEHFIAYGLDKERGVNADLMQYLYYSTDELLAETFCKEEQLRTTLTNLK